jgi:hypothetical protein
MAADDAGLLADQVARIGAGPVAIAVLDGSVKLMRCRNLVSRWVSHPGKYFGGLVKPANKSLQGLTASGPCLASQRG